MEKYLTDKKHLRIDPMLDSAILSQAILTVKKVFKKGDNHPLFHSYSHIKECAAVVRGLVEDYDFNAEELEILLLANWFYFAGMKTDAKKFKRESLKFASHFFEVENYSQDRADKVLNLLVEDPSSTSSLSSQLLHDALISFKGRKRFFRKMELLRVEREMLFGKTYTDHQWEKIAYNRLVNCTFFTDAAKRKYQKRKAKNIRKQRGRINKAHKITTREKTGKEFGRGVDTLYRANYNNHISLSSIADGKANMMISINTIILSVIVTLSGAGFTFSGTFMVDHLRFTVPIFILLVGALVSVIFAILSARPKVTSHHMDMSAVEEGKSSLLFFGNYLQVSLSQYVNHLTELKRNQQKLYDSMSVDMYFLGKVLQTKYRMLSWSYNVFMVALAISVVAFSFIFFYTNL
ncbi:MAG: Pycsar system effector family protein [Bacteroidota bacterium]